MSSRAKAWAWAVEIPPFQKLVLLALAERHSDDAGLCFPSHARLARDTGLSVRGVRNQLKELESAGLIEVVHRTQDRVCQTNMYRLNIPQEFGTMPGSAAPAPRGRASGAGGMAPAATGGMASDAKGMASGAWGVWHQLPTEPIYEPNKDIAEHGSDVPSDVPSDSTLPADSKPKKGKEGTKGRKTPMPDDFGISERVQAWAKKNGYDQLEEHLDNFMLTCRSRGYTYVDWDSAFMRAVKDDWAKLRTPKMHGYGKAFSSSAGSPFAGAK